MTDVTYSSEPLSRKRVYYIGTDVLQEGYCLCYDRDSNTGSSAGGADVARAVEVEKPAGDNLKYFAGVLADTDAGKTGPCWIDLVEPSATGRLVKVFTDQNCTILTTRLALAAGTYAATAAGAATVTIATAMQTINRSAASGTVLAQLGHFSGQEAATVTATQTPLTKPTGGTTGGTGGLDAAAAGFTASKLNNNFARVVKQLNAVQTDVAAILASLKAAGIMSA
jgi:hypothetical protein